MLKLSEYSHHCDQIRRGRPGVNPQIVRTLFNSYLEFYNKYWPQNCLQSLEKHI